MDPTARESREAQIAEAAYAVLAEKGFGGLSMLAVAKRARASNETLYRWYGDKAGLFRALITRNADRVAVRLSEEGGADLIQTGTALLTMLLSAEAIALNRAAAADASDTLGAVLAEAGRGRVFPLLRADMATRVTEARATEATALWLDLLIGDWQIRLATGAMPQPDAAAIRGRAERAARLLPLFLDGDGATSAVR